MAEKVSDTTGPTFRMADVLGLVPHDVRGRVARAARAAEVGSALCSSRAERPGWRAGAMLQVNEL